MGNKLALQEPRLGIVQELDRAEHTEGWILLRTPTAIRIGHSWPPLSHDPASEWGEPSVAVPNAVWFYDHNGVVTLLGRDSWRKRDGMAWFEYRKAIIGGRRLVDYRRINGMRHVMPGLGHWIERPISVPSPVLDEKSKISSLKLDLKSPPPIKLTQALNFRLIPSFSYSQSKDITTIKQDVLIETNAMRRRTWTEHLELHRALRDLMRITTWHSVELSELRIMHSLDAERTRPGTIVGDRWASVLQQPSGTFEEKKRLRYLFSWKDMGGSSGFRKWLTLQHEFRRGIYPILGTVENVGVALEITLAQAAIGLDGIGYQLALDLGLTEKAANQEDHKDRLLRVFEDLTVAPNTNSQVWAAKASNAYNAVKHANRQEVPFDQMIDSLRLHRLIFRLWVAGRVGVSKESLQTSLRTDPMHRDAAESEIMEF